MRKIIILILVSFCVNTVFADNFTYRYPYHNKYMRYNQYNTDLIGNNRFNNRIKNLERYALNKTYGNESEISRLERLENLTFGSIQGGDINTRFRNVENAILTKGQNSYKRNFLSTIGNYFAGQATGLTPNIIQYGNSFYPNYNNSYFNQYSNGIFSHGYTNFGNTYGSGGSIKVLE